MRGRFWSVMRRWRPRVRYFPPPSFFPVFLFAIERRSIDEFGIRFLSRLLLLQGLSFDIKSPCCIAIRAWRIQMIPKDVI